MPKASSESSRLGEAKLGKDRKVKGKGSME